MAALKTQMLMTAIMLFEIFMVQGMRLLSSTGLSYITCDVV